MRDVDWFRVVILVAVVAACALFWLGLWLLLATPRSAPIPTGPQPGASAAFGSADASARVQAAASGLAPLGAPQPARFPEHPGSTDSDVGGAPQSAGGIGTALVAGWATWCAPTPTQCQAWGGDALLGATPTFAAGDRPYRALVCRDGSRCVAVTVVSFCGCRDRHGRPTVIDLSPAAFEQLAPLGRGVVQVTVEWPIESEGAR